jgi:hypothetical protein
MASEFFYGPKGGGMRGIINFIAKEPVAVSEALRNTILMLVLFGVIQITEAQLVGLMAVVGSFLALAARSASTPNIKLPEEHKA